ncbi:3-oxo-tetronate kinase [Salinisphaera sp. SPP-AMP-43]|uniref:3-oxo-tetronate kinase n=1 Tax=Salinisphaera sp. SPP-AMP-43 TaxID=3121288 RepID=UPI003C6E0E0A
MPIIGCIADDFTGGTDLANNLVKSGFRTVQTIGVPDTLPEDVDAIVIALKSRSIAAETAIAQSLAALDWLEGQGFEKFYFKYCSTFDSTPQGNIGPVAEALMHALGETQTVFCPAFPATGRTVYQGHLFVGDTLLNESGMQSHPLNPMTDANLVRWLAHQSEARTGLLPAEVIEAGEQAATDHLQAMNADGCPLVVTDTLSDAQLTTIARASRHLRLVTGGSGLALGLGALYEPPASAPADLPKAHGGALILAGSASQRTREQIAHAREHMPAQAVDPLSLAKDFEHTIERILAWAAPRLGAPLLIHSDTRPEIVEQAQHELGVTAAGELVERALAALAERLVARDIARLIIAGGETSGTIVNTLGIHSLRIGGEIDPGVPWTFADSNHGPLHLALKSGNFGAPDMFTRAWDLIND